MKVIELLDVVFRGCFLAIGAEPAVGFIGEEDDVFGVVDGEDERRGGWANSLQGLVEFLESA